MAGWTSFERYVLRMSPEKQAMVRFTQRLTLFWTFWVCLTGGVFLFAKPFVDRRRAIAELEILRLKKLKGVQQKSLPESSWSRVIFPEKKQIVSTMTSKS